MASHQDISTIVSLRRQLGELEKNLLYIQERKAKFVLSTEIPLTLLKEEQQTEEQIAELKLRIKELEQSIPPPRVSRPQVQPQPQRETEQYRMLSSDRLIVRCVYRSRHNPDRNWRNFGFRVVVSLVSLSSVRPDPDLHPGVVRRVCRF